jgi:GMP synthase (glutamine-hydrolysing)
MGEPGARPRHRHIEGWFRHDGAVARWSGAFLRRWLAGGQTSALPGWMEPSGRQDSAGDP